MIKRLSLLFLMAGACGSGMAEEASFSECAYCRLNLVPTEPARDGRKYAPSKEIDVLHLKLDVTPRFEERSISGVASLRFVPVGRPLRELKLDAVDLTIDAVTASAAVQNHENTGVRLVITFREAIPVGEEHTVEVVYSAEPELGLYFRTPEMGYRDGDTHCFTQGETHGHRHWYPGYDYPNERFTTEVICRVHEGMVALSNGRKLSANPDPETGLVAWHWLQDKPHVNYLLTLCAGYFESIEDRHRDIPMAFWMPPSRMEHAAVYFESTGRIMAFFEDYIGVPYPWDKYDQVVVDDFVAGGMENTSQTTLTTRSIQTRETSKIRSAEGLVAHELAHQWFGDLITCKDWSHTWLNEGFATYYDALYHEHTYGRDHFLWRMRGHADRILSQKQAPKPMVWRDYQRPFEQFDYRTYSKGSWILHMLRSQLGDELYRRCVKTYLERHAFDVARTEDLMNVIEELSGRDWDQFFDQYVFHAHHPELAVAYSWDEKTGLAKISVEQRQKLSDLVLTFSVPLKVRFQSGEQVVEETFQVTQAKEDFYLRLSEKPDVVRVDPALELLAKIDVAKPRAMLFDQIEDTGDMVGRILAIKGLAEKADKKAVDAIRERLDTDPFWGVREVAASTLREIGTEEAREALLSADPQEDDRARMAWVNAIGGCFHERVPDCLTTVIEDESNPLIAASAIRGLAPYAHPTVRATLTRELATDSHAQLRSVAAMTAMQRQRNPAYIQPMLARLQQAGSAYESRDYGRGLAALATLASEEETKDPVRAFLVSHLGDPKDTVVAAAAHALEILNDPQTIAALETLNVGRPESRKRKAVQQALTALKSGRKPDTNLKALHEDFLSIRNAHEKLQKDVEALKKRFDAGEEAPEGESDPPEPSS